MFGLHLGLQTIPNLDTTPGGATDVWLWEPGIGLQWESGSFIQLD